MNGIWISKASLLIIAFVVVLGGRQYFHLSTHTKYSTIHFFPVTVSTVFIMQEFEHNIMGPRIPLPVQTRDWPRLFFMEHLMYVGCMSGDFVQCAVAVEGRPGGAQPALVHMSPKVSELLTSV